LVQGSNPGAGERIVEGPENKRAGQSRPGSAGNAGKEEHETEGIANAQGAVYAALDLGTNNCRLLVARPTRRGFHVIDAFSRIIRLGEGVSSTGRLSDGAMSRTIDALRVCSNKLNKHHALRSRLVATEACRIAVNGPQFIERAHAELGLDIEILSREDEAKLAVSGCASLIDVDCDLAMVFDIGGGSSELIWLDLTRRTGSWRRSLADRLDAHTCIAAWTSLPVGVVTLAERFGGRHVSEESFEAMVQAVLDMIAPFAARHDFRQRLANGKAHLLGTSGTVTTLAGILLGLERYDRSRVDGCWLAVADVRRVTYGLLRRSYEERVAEPCIGRERADLVLAGCAILEAFIRMWPTERLRVADRGLREGILATLMAEDGQGTKSLRSGPLRGSWGCGWRSGR
jgi:exopolyphosphatase/guanosine-5'-triphosphate,3'-diphosphate pyrophosphatase